MQKSESIAALAKALADAQQELETAKFDRDNPFFKSRYATLAAVMDSLKPIHKHGLAISQLAGAYRTESGVTVSVETVLTHSSGEWISSHLEMKPVKDDPQGVGSAITYARRYAAAAIVGLASEEDDDGNEASGKKAPPKPPQAPKAEKPKADPPKPPTPPEPTKPAAATPAQPTPPAPKLKTTKPKTANQNDGIRVRAIKDIYAISMGLMEDSAQLKKTIGEVINRSFVKSDDLTDEEVMKVLKHYQALKQEKAAA